MKVKDYPEYGTIYEIGNAKIIALDREDKMLNICCPTLVQDCKNAEYTLYDDCQREMSYNLIGRSNQISLIIGVLSGNIKKMDLVHKFYSSYCFSGYCYEGYNIEKHLRKGIYVDLYYTNGKSGLEKIRKDKQLVYNLKFSESNEYHFLHDKSMELENWYDRVMKLRLSDKKNTIDNLLEHYYAKCFKTMSKQLVELGDTKQHAYQTLIKEAKENVKEFVRKFKVE